MKEFNLSEYIVIGVQRFLNKVEGMSLKTRKEIETEIMVCTADAIAEDYLDD